MASFEEDFGNFITARCEAAYTEVAKRKPTLMAKREALRSRYRDLWGKLKDKVGFQLLDEFENTSGLLAAMNADICYFQGLRDGLKLARVLGWLGEKEEPEEGGGEGSEEAV